jgi:hypothetical protein
MGRFSTLIGQKDARNASSEQRLQRFRRWSDVLAIQPIAQVPRTCWDPSFAATPSRINNFSITFQNRQTRASKGTPPDDSF